MQKSLQLCIRCLDVGVQLTHWWTCLISISFLLAVESGLSHICWASHIFPISLLIYLLYTLCTFLNFLHFCTISVLFTIFFPTTELFSRFLPSIESRYPGCPNALFYGFRLKLLINFQRLSAFSRLFLSYARWPQNARIRNSNAF